MPIKYCIMVYLFFRPITFYSNILEEIIPFRFRWKNYVCAKSKYYPILSGEFFLYVIKIYYELILQKQTFDNS